MEPTEFNSYAASQAGGSGGVGSVYRDDREWQAPPPVVDPGTGESVQYGGSRSARPSLFNRYSIFFYNSRVSGASTPEDYEDSPSRYPGVGSTARSQDVQNNPTAAQLVRWSRTGKTNACEYDWPDFLWCADYGAVPNNYMVTLRRFPGPCSDDLFDPSKNPSPDIGRMVAWVDGEKNSWENVGLKWKHAMTWRKLEADIQEVSYQRSGAFGYEGLAGGVGSRSTFGIGKVSMGNALKTVAAATQDGLGRGNLSNPKNDDFNPYEDKNTVYGPVDIIREMWVRDKGLTFEQSFTLKFEYELKSIDGINPKVAFMDLLSNVLICTANKGAFWGGEVRHFGGNARRIKPFGDPTKLQAGDYKGYFDSFISGIMGRLTSLTDGQGFSLAGLGNAAKTIGSNMLGNVLGGVLDDMGRPGVIALQSLLSGEDTGMWHVTVGNPANPIVSMGNLVLDDTEVYIDGPLGMDDFPSRITVTCSLKPARPRDRTDIISMFHRNARTYLTDPPQAEGYAGNLVRGGQTPNAQFASGADVNAAASENALQFAGSAVRRFPNHADADRAGNVVQAARNIGG